MFVCYYIPPPTLYPHTHYDNGNSIIIILALVITAGSTDMTTTINNNNEWIDRGEFIFTQWLAHSIEY